MHKIQRIHLDDPHPSMPSAKTAHGRLPNRLQAHASAVRVDQWAQRATGGGMADRHGAR